MRLTEQHINTEFLHDGFIKLNHFLNIEQLKELDSLYQSSNIAQPENTMYSNFHELNFEKNQKIEQEIIRICSPSIEKHLTDFRIVGAAFILKGIGKDSDSRLHQDWRIVDETKYKSAIVWIPLMDVDSNNGCLQVIPESHNWFDSIRSSTVSSVFLKFDYKINLFVKPVPLKRGECVVFASKVFHGSKQNLSEKVRPAITITLIDKEARYIDYFKDKTGHVKVLDCNDRESFQHSFKTYNGENSDEVKTLLEMENIEKYEVTENQFLKRLYREKGKSNFLLRLVFLIISPFLHD